VYRNVTGRQGRQGIFLYFFNFLIFKNRKSKLIREIPWLPKPVSIHILINQAFSQPGLLKRSAWSLYISTYAKKIKNLEGRPFWKTGGV